MIDPRMAGIPAFAAGLEVAHAVGSEPTRCRRSSRGLRGQGPSGRPLLLRLRARSAARSRDVPGPPSTEGREVARHPEGFRPGGTGTSPELRRLRARRALDMDLRSTLGRGDGRRCPGTSRRLRAGGLGMSREMSAAPSTEPNDVHGHLVSRTAIGMPRRTVTARSALDPSHRQARPSPAVTGRAAGTRCPESTAISRCRTTW